MTELLADHTTLRLGGPAGAFTEATTEDELIAAPDEALLIAGGSNLVVADAGYPGPVVKVATRGVRPDGPTCGGVVVRVAAGENWDDFVATATEQGWVGVEALSGIPGAVGSTPIQNVGAYGQEVAQTIASVRAWDRQQGVLRTFSAAECEFRYRHSLFKAQTTAGLGRYTVLSVDFQLAAGTLSAPVQYAELARTLDVEVGQRAPLYDVRQAVLGLRRGKGMVLDAADHDTWSAGSFFTNPFLTPAQADALPEDAPRWPQPDGRVKSSAAWLIEQAGFRKGYAAAAGRVSLSTKHTLALTNRGGASTADLLTLAREVRDGVAQRFGVELVNEPVFVGVSL